MKTKDRIISIVVFAGLFLIGAIPLIQDRQAYVNAFKGEFPEIREVLSENPGGNIPEGYYELSVDASFGCFATKTSDGSVTEAYYAVWLDDDSVAAIAVGEKSQDELDKITDWTWDYVDGKVASFINTPFKGIVKVTEFTGDLHTMYRQNLSDVGITNDNFVIRDVLLDYTEGKGIKSGFFTSIILALVGLVGTLAVLFVGKKKTIDGISTFPTEAKGEKVVSASQAVRRITDADIKKCYSRLRLKAVLWTVATVALIIIPACMYAYTAYKNRTETDRKADYNLDEAFYPDTAKENETATVTIDSEPLLVCNEDGKSFYLLYSEWCYVGILDKTAYNQAVKDIEENGEAVLYGYFEEPTDTAKKSILKYTGTANDASGYDGMFGKYALNVEGNYAGVGVPLEKIKTFYIAAGVFILCGLIFGWSALKRWQHMVNGLRVFSDTEYAQIEREMASQSTVRFPQNLLMTENYLVMLDSLTAYKDNSNAEDCTLFVKYKDISWIYPSNHVLYGRTTNVGITVCGPKFGKSVILGQPAGGEGEKTVAAAYTILAERCPNALQGYTEENKQKAAQFMTLE